MKKTIMILILLGIVSISLSLSVKAADEISPTYSANSTNSTENGTDITHRLNWTDETELSGYIFSFCNGTWNGDNCLSESRFPSLDNPIAISGSGTAVTDCSELQFINESLSSYYYLANDIDCSDTINWNDGKGFFPIGHTFSIEFTGTLDGRGHTISDLYMNRSALYAGIFGNVDFPGNITGVKVVNVTITSTSSYVGGLVGYNGYKLTNCSVINSTIKGAAYTGGLVGFNNGGYLSYLFVENVIVTGTSQVGGLGGYAASPTSTINSYAYNVIVNGTYNVGGLYGASIDSILNRTYSSGNVTGGENVGGLTGKLDDSFTSGGIAVIDSFSTCNVNRNDTISAINKTINSFIGDIINAGGRDSTNVPEGYIVNSYWFDQPFDYPDKCHINGSMGCTEINSTNGGVLYFYDSLNLPLINWSFLPWIEHNIVRLQNDTWAEFPNGGTNDWSNVTKHIGSTIGTNYAWCVHANDTSNNWNSTSCDNPFHYTTTYEEEYIILPPIIFSLIRIFDNNRLSFRNNARLSIR